MTIALLLLIWLLVLTLLVDFLQTLTIAKNPQIWHERNPLLGKHPSPARVCYHFLGALILLALITIYVPTWYAILIVTVWLVVEVILIWNNNRIGIQTELFE